MTATERVRHLLKWAVCSHSLQVRASRAGTLEADIDKTSQQFFLCNAVSQITALTTERFALFYGRSDQTVFIQTP